MCHCPTLLLQLHHRGYRITPQREMIVQALAGAGDHITAEQILDEVKNRSNAVNIATVYRTLEMLVKEGLVSRINLGDGCSLYATHFHGSHVHLVCHQCGRLTAAAPEMFTPLINSLQEQYGFQTNSQHLSLTGLCTDCLKKIEKKKDR